MSSNHEELLVDDSDESDGDDESDGYVGSDGDELSNEDQLLLDAIYCNDSEAVQRALQLDATSSGQQLK